MHDKQLKRFSLLCVVFLSYDEEVHRIEQERDTIGQHNCSIVDTKLLSTIDPTCYHNRQHKLVPFGEI